MFKLMDKNKITILRKLSLLNWPYGGGCVRHCVESLSKTLHPLLTNVVLVQSRKRSNMTEKVLTCTLNINTNKIFESCKNFFDLFRLLH